MARKRKRRGVRGGRDSGTPLTDLQLLGLMGLVVGVPVVLLLVISAVGVHVIVDQQRRAALEAG